jgi:hypothetical protein
MLYTTLSLDVRSVVVRASSHDTSWLADVPVCPTPGCLIDERPAHRPRRRIGLLHAPQATETGLSKDEEPDDFVDTFEGTILETTDGETGKVAGKFRAYRIRLSQAEAQGESFHDVFDAHSQPLSDYHAHLFVDGNEFSPKIKGHEDIFEPNVLILDLIEILPQHRKKGLGLMVAHRLITLLGVGCGLVAC